MTVITCRLRVRSRQWKAGTRVTRNIELRRLESCCGVTQLTLIFIRRRFELAPVRILVTLRALRSSDFELHATGFGWMALVAR
jgi:hypothetical protein